MVDDADFHDHGILLEYQMPMTSKRLDCMVTGQDGEGRDAAVTLSLKRWKRCGDAGAEDLVMSRFALTGVVR